MDYPPLFLRGIIFWAVPSWTYMDWSMPGVYMLCRRESNGSRTILYIGEAEDIAQRLGPEHEHWSDALALGMNEVHVHLLAKSKSDRLSVETMLRNCVATPLNRQSPTLQGLGLLRDLAVRRRNALMQGAFAPERRNALMPESTFDPLPINHLALARILMDR